jgi:hypothetical protein
MASQHLGVLHRAMASQHLGVLHRAMASQHPGVLHRAMASQHPGVLQKAMASQHLGVLQKAMAPLPAFMTCLRLCQIMIREEAGKKLQDISRISIRQKLIELKGRDNRGLFIL